MPMKPLSFKGDAKPKKRKHRDTDAPSSALVPSSTSPSQPHPSDVSTDEDTWTAPDQPSDLTGPTLLVLPTIPPTCLASDAHGNVFASMLENLVDGHADTAEPHDVRQVWVANSVVGTSEVSFKASHGGYLGCDRFGVLGARKEARGVEEGFAVEAVVAANEEEQSTERVRWRVRTAADGKDGSRYLCAIVEGGLTTTGTIDDDDDEEGNRRKKKISISLRGDGDAASPTTELIVKMQARFKPRLQQSKATKAKEKISRSELERAVGRKLDDDEAKRLKRARRNGTYHEEILDVRVKGKHDKFAS